MATAPLLLVDWRKSIYLTWPRSRKKLSVISLRLCAVKKKQLVCDLNMIMHGSSLELLNAQKGGELQTSTDFNITYDLCVQNSQDKILCFLFH